MAADEHLENGSLRAAVLDRANLVDVRIQAVLDRLDLDRTDAERERVIDAIMGLCLAADAARAYARDDVESGDELSLSMARYADRVLGATE